MRSWKLTTDRLHVWALLAVGIIVVVAQLTSEAIQWAGNTAGVA